MIIDTNIFLITGFPLWKIYSIIGDIDSYYYNLKKPKKKYGENQIENYNIRYRDLYPSLYPLKQIQQRIAAFLQKIELPEYAFGSVKNRNNILNARMHVDNKHFFSIDLKNYFTNITHHQVYEMFKQNGFNSSISRTLTQLTTYKGCLPQGAPTSPLIANLVFVNTGEKLLNIIEGHGITFTTFLDDFTFSSKNDFKYLHKHITDNIISGGFYLNYKKITYKTYNSEVTGIFIDRETLKLKRAMQRRMEANKNCAGYLKKINSCNVEIKRSKHTKAA